MTSPEVCCPIHKNSDSIVPFWEFTTYEDFYKLLKCEKCDIVFYSPFPSISYESHTDNITTLKDYVHLNSNIERLITNLLDYIPQEGYTSMMEVGCGFGFTLDFARQMLDMEVIGYEPSLYGEVGASELGLDIKRTYLTAENVRDKKVDLIYLSEVLEHIEDPVVFLALLKNGLSDTGVLILTTPNYQKLERDLTKPSELALLSPGAHTILFSRQGLIEVLKKAGFTNVEVDMVDTSFVAVSAMQPKNWRLINNKNGLLRQYYHKVLDRVTSRSLTYTGILYRLFRNYIDYGNFQDAEVLYRKYPFPHLPTMNEARQIKSTADFDAYGPTCSTVLIYYTGMLKLNHYNDFEAAASDFQISFLLCSKKLELLPSAAVLEYGVLWLAKYHQALSLFKAGNGIEALQKLKHILLYQPVPETHYLPVPDENIKNLSTGLRNRILDSL